MSHAYGLRVRLAGGPEHSATFASIAGDGSLVVEFYDHSDQAEHMMGNDVAYLITIRTGHKERVLKRLLGAASILVPGETADALLLMVLSERFESYFDVRDWLDANDLPFHKSFDGRA
jgi:hypothetical protein